MSNNQYIMEFSLEFELERLLGNVKKEFPERTKQNLCRKCDKTFISLVSFNKHMKLVHGSLKKTKVTCPLCSKLISKRSLTQHIKAIHKGFKHKCSLCDKQYADPASLSRHVRVNHKGVKYRCPQCDKQFSYQISLSSHMEQVHQDIKELFPCGQCDKSYSSRPILKRHIREIHQNIKEVFSCDLGWAQFLIFSISRLNALYELWGTLWTNFY